MSAWFNSLHLSVDLRFSDCVYCDHVEQLCWYQSQIGIEMLWYLNILSELLVETDMQNICFCCNLLRDSNYVVQIKKICLSNVENHGVSVC